MRMENKGLKYILLLNELNIQKWQYEALRKLNSEGLAQAVLIIIPKAKTQPISTFTKLKKYPYKNLLFRFWKRFRVKTQAQEWVALPDFLKNTPVLEVETTAISKFKESFHPKDLLTINSYQADFIIRFGFGILSGDILNICPKGILSYHHGDEISFRGGPPGFWEIVKQEKTVSVVVQQLSEKLDAGIILNKRSLLSINHSYSTQLNRLLFNSSDMLAQIVRSNHWVGNAPTLVKPINTFPENLEFIQFLIQLFFAKFQFHYQQIFKKEKWNIALAQRDGLSFKLESVQPLFEEEAGMYAADPFIWKWNNKTLVFYEFYSYQTLKGSIRMGEIIDGKISKIKTLLEDQTHYAYPFIFEEDGKLYCAPENLESGSWNAYEIDVENGKIIASKCIHPLPLVDASLVKKEGVYYIFAGLPKEANEALHIWYSDSIWGPYQAHPANPIVSSPTHARMGGNFIQEKGKIFRPSQKSDRYYGEEICWNEVILLNKTNYQEKPVQELNAQFHSTYNKGIHTFSSYENLCVIDFKKHSSDKISLASHFRKRSNVIQK